jgi:hypothetical protein
MLGDLLTHRTVGPVIDGRSRRSHEQTTATFTPNLVPPRPRDDSHLEQDRSIGARHEGQRTTDATVRTLPERRADRGVSLQEPIVGCVIHQIAPCAFDTPGNAPRNKFPTMQMPDARTVAAIRPSCPLG